MKDVSAELAKLKAEIVDRVHACLRLSDPAMAEAVIKSSEDSVLQIQLVDKSSFKSPLGGRSDNGIRPDETWTAYCKNGVCQVDKDPPGICIVFKDPTPH